MKTNVENEEMTPEETMVGCGCVIVIVALFAIIALISVYC